MNNKAILYLSRAARTFSEADITPLYQDSLKANKSLNLSGFLCFKDNHFLQYIEGDKAYIDIVYDNIQEDPRHTVLVMIEDDNISELRFQKWSMHLVNTSQTTPLEISFSLYEQLLMLEGHESISASVKNLVWQGVDVVSNYHIDLHS